VGAAVRTGVRRGCQSPPAHRRRSLARGRDLPESRRDLALPLPSRRPVRPGHRRLPLTSPGRQCSPLLLRASDQPDPNLTRRGHYGPVPGLSPCPR
jgi:hypothetical protein